MSKVLWVAVGAMLIWFAVKVSEAGPVAHGPGTDANDGVTALVFGGIGVVLVLIGLFGDTKSAK